VTKESIV